MRTTESVGDRAIGAGVHCSHTNGASTFEHVVQFYESETFLIDMLRAHIASGLRAGEACIVVATQEHREGLEQLLAEGGFDLDAERRSGRYVALDAEATLTSVSTPAGPDSARFREVIGGIIVRAGRRWTRLRVYGEMVMLLSSAGDHAAATRLEELWNGLWAEMHQDHAFSLLCAYPMTHFGAYAQAGALGGVCDRHARVFPTETFSELSDPDDKLRAVALLQQKASALESEIEQRRRVEAALLEETRTLDTINRIGSLLAAELDLERLVQAVTDEATQLTRAEFGAFFYNVTDPGGESYMLYTLSGVPREKFSRFPMPRNTGMFGPTFRGEGVVRIDDVHTDPRYGHNPPYYGLPLGHVPVSSYLAVPVASRTGEVIGGLFFGHSLPGVFDERAERIVVGLAAQTAVAMENARLYRQAQEAVRMRDEFLVAASHDLKTPLTVVLSQAQSLHRRLSRDCAGSDKMVAGLESIQRRARMMATVIDELVDVTRLQAGDEMVLECAATDLGALVRDLAEAHALSAPGHTIVVEIPDEQIIGIWDQVRLTRVLGNLLGNAIKYSPEGGAITLIVSQERDKQGACGLVRVRDRGLGIPQDVLPHIFEHFYRGHNVVGKTAGTGIGLATAKQIVERHGGSISVASKEHVGTTFTVRLPLRGDY